MSSSPISLADLNRLLDAEAPDLVQAIERFLDQSEPWRERPQGSMTADDLRRALRVGRSQRSKRRRQEKGNEVWQRYLAQSPDEQAPQMALAPFVEQLYERKSGPARHALLTLIGRAPLMFGLWGGLKRLYKRAEAEMDAEVWGALTARFDAETRQSAKKDVSVGTLKYLAKRSARFLRQLGKAVPELYPTFCVEVLRAYPERTNALHMTVGGQIDRYWHAKWGGTREGKEFRAPYRDAWQRSPDPLMLLLETCRNDGAAKFAIAGLRELFPDTLRGLGAEWLARLCFRPLPSAHTFVVATLESWPSAHAANLASLGLHDAVLALLKSRSPQALKYAVTYARGHGASLTTDFLAQHLDERAHDRSVVELAAGLLTSRPPREIGMAALLLMLGCSKTRQWAQNALENDFDRADLTWEVLADLVLHQTHGRWATSFVNKKFPEGLDPAFWIGILDDPRLEGADWNTGHHCIEALGKTPVSKLPVEWLLKMLSDDDWGYEVAGWLEEADALPAGLDAERIKGLIFDVDTRDLAFTLLGSRKLFSPEDLDVSWVLTLARRADPSLHQWAQRYLFEHVKPGMFVEPSGDEAARAIAGANRLLTMATGSKETETARLFAQTYLSCHHPKLATQTPEARDHGVTPALPREAFLADRIWPMLWDDRADVRRFGVALTRAELVRWGDFDRVYELAESPAREVRTIAYDALSQAGDEKADPDLALPVDRLDPALVFSLTESRISGTRDVGMTLIRKHYSRLGGAERLGWLMQSTDREVRMFAVRLLWEKHRPRAHPDAWQPKSMQGKPVSMPAAAGPFDDVTAMRNLLRRMLFAVPPARGGEKGSRRGGRRLPANVAKRRIVEVVRDFGLRDRAFAEVVAPVLGEFTGSLARGEWESCLAALMSLREAHGMKVEELV